MRHRRGGSESELCHAYAMAPFERVWALIKSIPRGRVATYGQLSRMIDRRLTPVGIGWALRAAPDGSIPWQRVVNAQGGVSTDKEHPGLQRTILEAEGVRFNKHGLIDLELFGWEPSDFNPDPDSATPRPRVRRAVRRSRPANAK